MVPCVSVIRTNSSSVVTLTPGVWPGNCNRPWALNREITVYTLQSGPTHLVQQSTVILPVSQRLSVPGVARRASEPVTSSFKGKGAQQLLEQLQRPPLVPKDGLGQFANIPHYQRILDSCKAAFTNYQVREDHWCPSLSPLPSPLIPSHPQVSLSSFGEDKFSRLLQAVHTTLAGLLEVSSHPVSQSLA